MKGKVICQNCGHSWNKSDSSEKDMHVCHNCGKSDVNMKNGGWLDSYADGGTMQEHQENYNDYKVSASPDMIGDGYSNVGRNYSPAWGGQFQDGGYVMGTYFDEDARERIPNMMEETYDDYNTAMKGMMKSKMATQAALGNPGARRMMSNMPAKYMFTGEERFSDGTPAEGAGAYGSHYISNRDNYVYPNLQDNGEGTLNFIPDASPSDREAMRFENADEADYFANHYKTVAPMMKDYNKMAMGGSVPGSVGFTYARTKGIPSKGPHRNKVDKTDASAQNGMEMKYYQNGLDWKPKTISREGSVIKDNRGQWDHPGEITEINSNDITMQGVPYPVLGISDTGDTKLMKPGKDYKFKGKKVTEFPMAKNGMRQEQKGLVNLDDLTNFTNYNKSQPSGWLSKYE